MLSDKEWFKQNEHLLIPFLYLFSRIVLFLTLVPYGYFGIGDLQVYREWTALPGWPYLDYWVEYPPLFPFLSEIIYRISGNQDFIYDFLMALVLGFAGAATLYFFGLIAQKLYNETSSRVRLLILFGFMVTLPYIWWYADSTTLFFMIAAIWAIISNRDRLGGIWIGLGILSKWFPVFLLPALYRQRSAKRIFTISTIAILTVAAIFVGLYLIAPEMTRASVLSQPGRSSWQTVWALIDGNLTTGAYLTTEQRLDPSQSTFRTGNPPVVPPLLSFILFALIGIAILFRRIPSTHLNYLTNIGLVWILFLLWSPGWSSQWVLYLLPLVLLTFPVDQGILWCLALVTVNIIEFPFLLGRQIMLSLWILIPFRFLLYIIIFRQWVIMTKTAMNG
ncbi:MAG: hypothetical protein N2646_01740 [Bellilinea sp.]|nr:hypothetical protein [Bellilinea sp.]